MKLKKGFVIREVAGETLVVATGEASKSFHGMIKLNETGKFIWERLISGKDEDQILADMTEVYKEDPGVMKTELSSFMEKIEKAGFFDK